ncbi:hypothetical protein EP073_03440 [Geovibrio thiophilus]|uniref:Uncharacterized protein n=1 Tax=Geovibrio thiophilus TaxID=139438 RepID=A0A3R5UU22_9BACT|nr:hypothetical protein [Geovibrio thiophilus]QAR32489.1 hypothetical protein EP073_03440 [Geovibrio thiophilus]
MKYAAAFLLCFLTLPVSAAEIGFKGGFTSPDDLGAVYYGAEVSETIDIPNNHKLKLSADYKMTDFSDAAGFMPDTLTQAALGIDITGPEYLFNLKAGVSTDEPFEESDGYFAGIMAAKNVYESGPHKFYLGLVASNKELLDDMYILPAFGYSYTAPNLYILAGSLNMIKWKPAEKVSFEASLSVLGQGKVKGTYHWSRDFRTSLVYSNDTDTYYLGRDYPEDSELKIRIASVSLEAEKDIYEYAKLVLSAGMITSARYYILDDDDEVLRDKKISGGATGSAELRIMF